MEKILSKKDENDEMLSTLEHIKGTIADCEEALVRNNITPEELDEYVEPIVRDLDDILYSEGRDGRSHAKKLNKLLVESCNRCELDTCDKCCEGN